MPQLLFDYVCCLCEDRGSNKRSEPNLAEVLVSMSKGLRVAYTLMLLDTEVNNGGFYSVLYKLEGQLASQAVEDLILIGVKKHI